MNEHEIALKADKAAAKTGDAEASVRLAKHLQATDLKQAVSVLRKARPKTPTEELNLARVLVVYAEWAMRLNRGLPTQHALEPADMGFRFATNEWRRYRAAVEHSNRDTLDLHFIYFHEHGRERRFYEDVKGQVMGTVDFDVTPEHAEDGPKGEPAIWLGCDEKYLAFAEPFVRSIKSFGDIDVVLNVIEDHPLGHRHYHAERFIRLREWMKVNDRPVWIMDVDAIANRSPRDLFSLLDGYDVAMRGRPGRLEPWNQYNASVVGFNNTRAGKSYLNTVAAFIERAAQRNEIEWGVDQVALLCCLDACNPKLRFLDRVAVNYDYKSDGIIWCNSGANKWNHLDPNYVDPERQVYLDAFRKWSAPTAP